MATKTHVGAFRDECQPQKQFADSGSLLETDLPNDGLQEIMMIYRKSYTTGKIPEDWRRANVVAVFKKGRKSDITNMCVLQNIRAYIRQQHYASPPSAQHTI